MRVLTCTAATAISVAAVKYTKNLIGFLIEPWEPICFATEGGTKDAKVSSTYGNSNGTEKNPINGQR